jgi:citrate synthase
MSDQTKIGEEHAEGYILRGQPLASLIGGSFASAAFLAWFGRDAKESELAVFEACLVASLDHGAEPPSAQATRRVSGEGRTLAQSVAAGIGILDTKHGNAGGACAKWLRERFGQDPKKIVEAELKVGHRLLGFGHRLYERDPRTVALQRVAKDQVIDLPHFEFGLQVAEALSAAKGKTMPMNVDGAIGALCADLHWPNEIADALFILGRTAGLVAHARETQVSV